MGKRLNWALMKKRTRPARQLAEEKDYYKGDVAARWLERHDPMIDRQGNKILIECDSCDEVFSSNEGEEWSAVWASAKQEGWRSKKIGNEWVHGCPKCGVQ